MRSTKPASLDYFSCGLSHAWLSLSGLLSTSQEAASVGRQRPQPIWPVLHLTDSAVHKANPAYTLAKYGGWGEGWTEIFLPLIIAKHVVTQGSRLAEGSE